MSSFSPDVELSEIIDLQEMMADRNEETREMARSMDARIKAYVESQVPEWVKRLAEEILTEESVSLLLERKRRKRRMEREGLYSGYL